ncbi:MAG TPA: adenylate/guanylate cyclase domain-containing protein [Actinomycetota bacterium]|nr:adenylate/guanylate cyclase domain-containing protein [Actinomycetota bacterium]
MRGPLPPEQFSQQIGVPVDRVERYRSAGLLDPDRDGMLDDYDVLRLALLGPYEEAGYSPEQIVDELDKAESARIRRLFRFGQKTYDLKDAAEQLGVTLEQAEQLILAMGFAPESTMDEEDFETLRKTRAFMNVGIPWEGVLEGARVYADSLRRIAQAEINMTHRYLCERMEAEGAEDKEVTLAFYSAGPLLTDISNSLITQIHEDFLLEALAAHAVAHIEKSGSGTLKGALHLTVAFIDLALFTPLAQAHGDEVAAQVLDRLDAIVRKEAVTHRGSVVKQIGDAFMLTFGDEVGAVQFSAAILGDALQERDFPAVRIGLHSGPVLYRVGDYIGNTVNVASRVMSMAMPNVILMTEPVAEAAREAGIEIEDVGVRRIRGVEEELAIYRVATKRAPHIDPVCGMVVADPPAAKLVYDRREFVFCSHDCLKRFLADPDAFTPRAAAAQSR